MARMTDAKPIDTPMELNVKYKHNRDPVPDLVLYRTSVGHCTHNDSTKYFL